MSKVSYLLNWLSNSGIGLEYQAGLTACTLHGTKMEYHGA